MFVCCYEVCYFPFDTPSHLGSFFIKFCYFKSYCISSRLSLRPQNPGSSEDPKGTQEVRRSHVSVGTLTHESGTGAEEHRGERDHLGGCRPHVIRTGVASTGQTLTGSTLRYSRRNPASGTLLVSQSREPGRTSQGTSHSDLRLHLLGTDFKRLLSSDSSTT